MNIDDDIIVSIATPSGQGGIGVLRLSGSLLYSFALKLTHQLSLKPRHAKLVYFYDSIGEVLDQGLILFFPGPRSFTGEDVLEIHGHGGQVILNALLNRCVELGARLAQPGEFSKRSFLNGKIDLTQAEAIADLIDASSIQAAKSATRSLQGEFSKKIEYINQKLNNFRVKLEASIDFNEEVSDQFSSGEALDEIENDLLTLIQQTQQGRILRNGIKLVLTGAPNVGKSMLLNQLTGRETAIVADVAGTTRDVISDDILIHGLSVEVVDTAGIRDTSELVERLGIEKAKKELQTADIIIYVVDEKSTTLDPSLIQELSNTPVIIAQNKSDITGKETGGEFSMSFPFPVLNISAKTGEGIEFLKEKIIKSVNYQASEEGLLLARDRHLICLKNALSHIQEAKRKQEHQEEDLCAEEAKLAHHDLGEIIGKTLPDDLLGDIFSNFCLGK